MNNVPMTILLPEETYKWMCPSAAMMGTSRHKFLISIITDAHHESEKPENESGQLLILQKLRAVAQIEKKAKEPPLPPTPEPAEPALPSPQKSGVFSSQKKLNTSAIGKKQKTISKRR